MQPEDRSASQSESHEGGNPEAPILPSNEIPENQPAEEQNLQGSARHEPRRARSRRRGRRRGRRRRRGQQRARARARAREEAQIAMVEVAEGAESTSEESESESRFFRDGLGSARSRSPRRQRSLDNEDLSRHGIAEIRPRLQYSSCRVPNCDWSGPLEAASQHVRIAHDDAILRGPRQRLSVPLAFAAYTRYWRLVDAFDELFLVQFRRRADSRRRLQAAVQLVGPASTAAQFLYLLHMQVVESQDQNDPITSTTQPTPNCITTPPPSTTRISLILGQTSSTRVDLEPAMISLWSAYNFSQTGNSLENVSPCLPVLHSEDNISENTSTPRVLDLTLTIQRIFDQKE